MRVLRIALALVALAVAAKSAGAATEPVDDPALVAAAKRLPG